MVTCEVTEVKEAGLDVKIIGTDLTAYHPVSFNYDTALTALNGQLRDPSTLSQEVRLDPAGQVQCTSCHDAHNNQYGNFLVKDNTASAMCLDCHAPGKVAPRSAKHPHKDQCMLCHRDKAKKP